MVHGFKYKEFYKSGSDAENKRNVYQGKQANKWYKKVHVWKQQRHGVFQSVESSSQHNPDSDSLTNMFTVEHLLFINIISWRRARWVFVNIALGLSIAYVLVCCVCLCLPEVFFNGQCWLTHRNQVKKDSHNVINKLI